MLFFIFNLSTLFIKGILSKLKEHETPKNNDILWIPRIRNRDDVLDIMKNTQARIPKAKFEAKRDMYIFEEYLKIVKT